jgi:hypothetical protein
MTKQSVGLSKANYITFHLEKLFFANNLTVRHKRQNGGQGSARLETWCGQRYWFGARLGKIGQSLGSAHGIGNGLSQGASH